MKTSYSTDPFRHAVTLILAILIVLLSIALFAVG